ncbi:hypothetical protein O1M63_51850 [Streptomyces mirabilis]|nr:hypothetical protein [Streptomyces mirabilis]
MKWIPGVAGGLLLLLVFASILRTLVVPRGLYSSMVIRWWRSLRFLLRLAAPGGSYRAIDRAQTWLAPLMLMGTLVSWLGGALIGFGLLLHAISSLTWTQSVREAGSSLFTLGFASGDRLHLSVVDFIAAVTGPVVIALQIAYLPTLYAAYNRRELEVTLLQSRAGEPAWGPEILARQWLVDTETALPELYRSWERLASDIGESHSTYPVLLAFRSPRPYRSWIVALVAVMDAAAIQLALTPGSAPPEARLVLRAGFTALRDIARSLRFPYDTDPAPDTPIQLTYLEFDAAVAMLEAAGFPAERTAEQAWPHFHGWRVNYETIAFELCRRGDAVPALWTGPRDFPSTPIPPARPRTGAPAKIVPNCPRPPRSSGRRVGKIPRVRFDAQGWESP